MTTEQSNICSVVSTRWTHDDWMTWLCQLSASRRLAGPVPQCDQYAWLLEYGVPIDVILNITESEADAVVRELYTELDQQDLYESDGDGDSEDFENDE